VLLTQRDLIEAVQQAHHALLRQWPGERLVVVGHRVPNAVGLPSWLV
jgi:hypothetical protein